MNRTIPEIFKKKSLNIINILFDEPFTKKKPKYSRSFYYYLNYICGFFLKMSEINPFELHFSRPETIEMEKDLLYKQLLAFLQYKSFSDMMVRLHKKCPNESDFEVRDIMNTGLFPEG